MSRYEQDELATYIFAAIKRSLIALYRRRLHAADLDMQRTGKRSLLLGPVSPRAQIWRELARCGYTLSRQVSPGTQLWSLPVRRGHLHVTIVNHNMTPELDEPSFHLRCRFTHVFEFVSPVLPHGVSLSAGHTIASDSDAMVRLDSIDSPGEVPQNAQLEFEPPDGERVCLDGVSVQDALRMLEGANILAHRIDALITDASQHVRAHELRLESWRCQADKLYLVYGAEIADLSDRARDARLLVSGMNAHADAFASWCERPSELLEFGSLDAWAWALFERSRAPGSLRVLAARVLPHFSLSTAQRQRFEERVIREFDADTLAPLVPSLGKQALDALDDEMLLDLGSRSDHVPLHELIARRIDFIEVLHDQTAPAYERDVALRGLLTTAESGLVLEHLPEAITRSRHPHVPQLCATLIMLAQDDLWQEPRVERALHARLSALPVLEQLVEHDSVLAASWSGAQRARLWELLGKVCLDARPERFDALAPGTMLRVMLHRAGHVEAQALAPVWRAWLARLSFVDVLKLLRDETLDFASWVRATRHILYLSRVKTDILYDRGVRVELLDRLARGMGQTTGLWSDPYPGLLDEVVLKMCDHDPDVFESAHDRSALERALHTYEEFVARTGLRAGALATLNELGEELPGGLRAWSAGVITRWKEELGARQLAGGLTHVEGGDRAGGLSLETGGDEP